MIIVSSNTEAGAGLTRWPWMMRSRSRRELPLSSTERDILGDYEAGVRAKIEREIEHRKIDDVDEPDTEEDAS